MQKWAGVLFKSNHVLIIRKQRYRGWKQGRISINRSSLKPSLRTLADEAQLNKLQSENRGSTIVVSHILLPVCLSRKKHIVWRRSMCACRKHSYGTLCIQQSQYHKRMSHLYYNIPCDVSSKQAWSTHKEWISIMTCLSFFYLRY